MTLIGPLYVGCGRREYVAEWMARNHALTFPAVTSRAAVPLVMVTLRVAGIANADQVLDTAMQAGQRLGWVINLVIVEILIRRRRSGRVARVRSTRR